MRIGEVEIGPGAALAPMAGVTDLAMRTLCAQYGAGFTVSEMVSAKAITMGDRKSLNLLRGRPCVGAQPAARSGSGAPAYGVQLFGKEPAVLAEAVKRLEGEDFDFLDLNLGCPAPKIATHGSGAGLLREPLLAEAFAAAAVKASPRPVTAKLRIGWDENEMTGLEVAKRLENAGVQMLAVHGRTRAQQYAPGVNHEAVAAIKAAVGIPVLFNGDVDSAEAAKAAIQRTGCDGVMIGRAAVGDPFLFAEVRAALCGQAPPAPPSLRLRLAELERQVRMMCEEKGEERAMREARKVAAGYLRGLRGAAALRRQAHALTYFTDLAALAQAAYSYQEIENRN